MWLCLFCTRHRRMGGTPLHNLSEPRNAREIGEIYDIGQNGGCTARRYTTCRSQGMVFCNIPIGEDDMGC